MSVSDSSFIWCIFTSSSTLLSLYFSRSWDVISLSSSSLSSLDSKQESLNFGSLKLLRVELDVLEL